MGAISHSVMGVSIPEGIGLLLPIQFFERHPSRKFEGERRLALAVLVDAIACWAKPTGKNRAALAAEAQAWLFGSDTEDWSFQRVCEAVEINPEYLRKGLLEWREVDGKLAFHRHGQAGTHDVVSIGSRFRDGHGRSRLERRESSTNPALRLEKPADGDSVRRRPPPVKHDPRNDPDERDLPGPEVNSDILDFWNDR